MAKKKPTEASLTNVLETAIELLQDAEDEGMISISNSVYLRLRAAVKEATGVAYGIAVSEDEDDDYVDEYDEDQSDEEDE
jgi:hypothetical protein